MTEASEHAHPPGQVYLQIEPSDDDQDVAERLIAELLPASTKPDPACGLDSDARATP